MKKQHKKDGTWIIVIIILGISFLGGLIYIISQPQIQANKGCKSLGYEKATTISSWSNPLDSPRAICDNKEYIVYQCSTVFISGKLDSIEVCAWEIDK